MDSPDLMDESGRACARPASRHRLQDVQRARLSAADANDIDAAVGADISPIDDVRSTQEYRIHAAKAAVRAFFRALKTPA